MQAIQGIAFNLHKKISCPILLQSPPALFLVKYHNPSPALLKPVALREYKNIQSGRMSSALYRGWCTKKKNLEQAAPCGHFLLPDNQQSEYWCSRMLVRDAAPNPLPLGLLVDVCVESKVAEWHWCRPPFLCAGRWREPAPDPQSPPKAEQRHPDLTS